MLKRVHTETSLFGKKDPPPERYLFIVVRERDYFLFLSFLSRIFEFLFCLHCVVFIWVITCSSQFKMQPYK